MILDPEVPLWNEKLKCFRKNKKKQTITFSVAAGNYDTEIIIDIKSQVLDLKTLPIFSPLKTQKRHHAVLKTSRVNLQMQCSAECLNPMLRKALSLFTICQKFNCYRSTTLLSGLGWTIEVKNQEVEFKSHWVEFRSPRGRIREPEGRI